MCVGQEVAGGDASDGLVDVHGRDLPRSPAQSHSEELSLGTHTPTISYSAYNHEDTHIS